MQLIRREATGSINRTFPKPVQDCPRLSEPVGVYWAHFWPKGIATIQFGLDQRRDVHAIDHEVLDVTVDVDVNQIDTAHHHSTQVDASELGVRKVDGVKHCAVHFDLFETGTPKVGVLELGHPMTLRDAS
jgi:hypothetical protein